MIDGERQSTKSESIQAILGRIPLASVERIEFIRESVAGVDMRGQTRVVNVVLREGNEAQTTVNAGFEYLPGNGRVTPSGSISRNWEFGDTRLTLGANFDQNAAPLLRTERLENSVGALIETRDERTSRLRTAPRFNASINTRFADESRLSLSFAGGWTDSATRDRSIVNDPLGGLSRIELFNSQGDDTSWEGTLTYERPLSESLSGQLVLLNRDDASESADEFIFAPAGGGGSTTFFNSIVDSGERAVRATLTWERNEQNSIEFGLETAINYRDNGLQISRDTGLGPVAVPLPVANTRVEEERSEVFASHVWRPNSDVTVESGFRLERSTIAQTGDAQRERSFDYPKPSINLTWDASENTQWTFGLERDVSQLSFGQFASEVSPTDNQVQIGNPELVPQKTWRASAAWERRWGEDGTVSISLIHERAEDVSDLRPITVVVDDTTTPVTTDTFDAPGNIGDGERTILQLEAGIPLDNLGLSNSRLNVTTMLRDSQVTDPTTGQTRRFQGNEDWRLILDFRQNLPEQDLAWGFFFYTQGDEDVFRYDQSYLFTTKQPVLDFFVESTAIEGVTLSVYVGDFLPQVRERERTFYTGSRIDNIVSAREIQEQDLGGFISFRARSTF